MKQAGKLGAGKWPSRRQLGAGTFKILALLKLAFHIFFELARSPTFSDIDRITANFVLSDESLLSGWIDTDWPLEKES